MIMIIIRLILILSITAMVKGHFAVKSVIKMKSVLQQHLQSNFTKVELEAS